MEPLIITCAITGAEVTKQQQPNLPTTPKEQALAVQDVMAAGASVVHLHVREDDGTPSQRVDRFKESVSEIRKIAPDVILQFSTGGAVGESFANRLKPLVLKPDMASLNMGSMNFGNDVFLNRPEEIKQLAAEMQKQNIVAELEIYEVGMLEMARRYLDQNMIQQPLHLQFVLGVPGGMSGELENLKYLLSRGKTLFTEPFTWAVAGIGRYEFPLAEFAIQNGGHVRVGFEDNIYISKGVLAKSNAELVQRVCDMAKAHNRSIATIAQSRQLLGLKS